MKTIHIVYFCNVDDGVTERTPIYSFSSADKAYEICELINKQLLDQKLHNELCDLQQLRLDYYDSKYHGVKGEFKNGLYVGERGAWAEMSHPIDFWQG
jgi:hypothetical protein